MQAMGTMRQEEEVFNHKKSMKLDNITTWGRLLVKDSPLLQLPQFLHDEGIP